MDPPPLCIVQNTFLWLKCTWSTCTLLQKISKILDNTFSRSCNIHRLDLLHSDTAKWQFNHLLSTSPFLDECSGRSTIPDVQCQCQFHANGIWNTEVIKYNNFSYLTSENISEGFNMPSYNHSYKYDGLSSNSSLLTSTINLLSVPFLNSTVSFPYSSSSHLFF